MIFDIFALLIFQQIFAIDDWTQVDLMSSTNVAVA